MFPKDMDSCNNQLYIFSSFEPTEAFVVALPLSKNSALLPQVQGHRCTDFNLPVYIEQAV